MTTDIQIVLYEGFDELDAIAPYEVLQNAARFGADITVRMVSLDGEGVVASHGLQVGVDGALGDPDLLLVPGGGWNDRSSAGAWTQVEQGDLPAVITRLARGDVTMASVCTGGMILAHAGVLDGHAATTHAGALDDLRTFEGVEVREERVVDDGAVLTAGGVTSGLELAFHLAERLGSAEIAARISEVMEYEPRSDAEPRRT